VRQTPWRSESPPNLDIAILQDPAEILHFFQSSAGDLYCHPPPLSTTIQDTFVGAVVDAD
jgi:hypothetical protein